VHGTEKMQPIGSHLPRLGVRISITFGKPMEVAGRSMDRASLRAITDELMMEIQKLTGQEYVGRYAPRRAD
jgi:1-acyl-sn-glycerol-3-phosphate acyltransferase